MVKTAIANAEQVTPEQLNVLLQEQGALPQGKVLSVIPCKTQSTFASSVSWLAVSYSVDAPSSAPEKAVPEDLEPRARARRV